MDILHDMNQQKGLFSFGANHVGELMLGDTHERLVPTEVPTDFKVKKKSNFVGMEIPF